MTGINENDIRKIMSATWGLAADDISPDVEFNQIVQWDSLGHVSLLIALEKEYNIAIDFEMLTKLVSIPAILQCIKDKAHVG